MAELFRDNAADMGDEWPSGVVGFLIFVSVILKSMSIFTLFVSPAAKVGN